MNIPLNLRPSGLFLAGLFTGLFLSVPLQWIAQATGQLSGCSLRGQLAVITTVTLAASVIGCIYEILYIMRRTG